MGRFRIALGLLLAWVTAALSPAAASVGSPCAAALAGWEKLADHTSTPPHSLFEGRFDVDRLLICDTGTYFFVKTRVQGRFARVCLAFPVSSPGQTTGRDGRDAKDVGEQLRSVLGGKYARDKLISFEKDRWQPCLATAPDRRFEFSLRRRFATFSAPFDAYYAPGSNVSPWVVFVLLFTGPVPR